jgi:medium-chain acyl-[acyl-carrier-protein] hydrolase
MRLFCFPPAGSGAAVYRSWAPLLGPGIQLCSMLPPGRETRFGEAPIIDFEDMITAASAAIQPWASEPFALFGHSLGSLVAYEVARRLTALGQQPAHLFVSGHDAPGLGSRRAPIAHLPEPEFLQGLIALGGTPPEIVESKELLALLLPMLRTSGLLL